MKSIKKLFAVVEWTFLHRIFPAFGIFTCSVVLYAVCSATSSVAYADTTSTQVVAEAPSYIAPIMERIAGCESGDGKVGSGTQFKNGQVVIHVNTNGTYDQGKYQINSIHNADAAKHGFNLATEEGNKGYAYFMFENLGTSDWASSSGCWKQ